MRRFLIVSHTVPADGQWGLDDLAGGAGRVDVLCRAINCALFTSHGIRDAEIYLHFQTGPAAIRIEGSKVNQLNPDERSTAARIRHALRAMHEDPWWEEVESGISVAPYGLEELLQEVGPFAVLDAAGVAAESGIPDATLVLSDHQPFTEAEQALLTDAARISLGATWVHGHQAITIVHYLLDR